MKIQVENEKIVSASLSEDCILGDGENNYIVDNPNDIDYFFNFIDAYIYLNNKIVLDENKLNEIIKYQQINALRESREKECFPIINRGQLWYESLSQEQIVELNNWYQDWLNVTETLVIPEKPSWI